jgi:hypothetical protein
MKSIFTDNTRDVHRYLVRATHAQKLERWIGAEQLAGISAGMRGWYGPPIAIAGVPGRVYACGDGDFCGPIKGGYFSNMLDYRLHRIKRALRNNSIRSSYTLNAGFSSLSDLISEATTGGKKQTLPYIKVGVAAPAAGASQSLRRVGTYPVAGAIFAAPPGGTVVTRTTDTGAILQANAAGGDQLHLINWFSQQTTAQNSSLMLMDTLFGVQPNYNSTASQSITGVPTRYQTAALAPGNVANADVTTVLTATAVNVTITYVDDAGNAAEAGTAQALRVSSAVNTSPFTQPAWYYALNAGDRGLRNMTAIQFSAATTPAAVDRLISHPLAIMPGAGIANQVVVLDGINSAFNFERIYDDAYLTLWEWMKSATAASTHAGQIVLVSG